MQLSSIEVALRGLQNESNSLDIDGCSGVDATRLVHLLVPVKHCVDVAVLSASARAVATNQHNVDGARNGATWIASKTGVSERQARADLATHKRLADLPDVAVALKSGEISLPKAAAVAPGAQGSVSAAESLLDVARTGTVEMIEARAQEINARRKGSGSRRERLRKSQFVNIRTNSDSMVVGEIRLLPENAVALCNAYRRAKGETSYERAESFARQISASGKKQSHVVFHLDLELVGGELQLGQRCELKGVGPVPAETALDVIEDASRSLVGTINNKLVWFSEQDRRSSTRPLPDYIKRAVLAKSWDRCDLANCVDPADHVDHIQARCNNGINDPENLQSLCEPDHHAKTKVDAPWTAGGVYGKKRKSPSVQEEEFSDTG